MRGVVLLVDPDGRVDPHLLRAEGLIVHGATDEGTALERLTDLDPDVVVVASDAISLMELRRRADHASSIIVLGPDESDRETLRNAGADAVLPLSADLLYEIHRALILRRSGRRLPWNS